MDSRALAEILGYLDKLNELNELGASDPAKCREFNSRSATLLDKLETIGANELADRVMDILQGCSPKEFSQCENRQCTKSSLERLRIQVRENLKK